MSSDGVTVARVLGPVVSWESQAGQHDYRGQPGIHLERRSLGMPGAGDFIQIDCLLYRDKRGLLVGILNHHSHDGNNPAEREGDITMWVDPHHQRQGIGTALLLDAMHRWRIDLARQRYTIEGLWFVNGLLRRRHGPKVLSDEGGT